MAEPTYKQIINHTIIDDLDILGDLNEAYIPISKDQTPAVVDPTGKTGKLYNASIETIMTQQLNDKLKDNTHLGDMCYNAGLMDDPNFGLADGKTEYSLTTEPQYYNWLLLQPQNVKDKHLLNTTAQTFRLPNYQEKDIGRLNFHLLPSSFHYDHKYGGSGQQSTSNIITSPYLLKGFDDDLRKIDHNEFMNILINSNRYIQNFLKFDPNDEYSDLIRIFDNIQSPLTYSRGLASTWEELQLIGSPFQDSIGFLAPSSIYYQEGTAPFTYMEVDPLQYIYIRLRISKSYTTNNYVDKGLGEMNSGYRATKLNQAMTKRDVINELLNYELPLSFSINDIGKRVPYYPQAENNPTLIALDGTKYLIADYPNFDYLQFGFTNDGVYFWYSFLSLDIQLHIEGSFNYDKEHNGYIRIAVGAFPITFNSKLVYNFLQTPAGANLLVADGVGKDKDNFGFTILDASTYKIRMNTNNLIPNIGRIIYGGIGQITPSESGSFIISNGPTASLPITGGRYLLKIKSDYMVAKIQQVGVVEGAGDLKKDGSVPMDVGYFPTAEQDISTKKYVDIQNSGFVKSDRSVGLIDMGTPFSDEPTAMKDLLSDNIKIPQTVKNSKTDITLTEKLTSVDISIGDIDTRVSLIETSTTDLTPRIDSLESDNTSNQQDIQTLTDITNLHTQALNVQTNKITALEDTSLSKVTGLMDASYDITKITQPENIITLAYLEYSNNISGDLKSDRSVLLTGEGTFNTKQIASMDDLKDSNIIITDSSRVITTLDSKLIDIDNKITTLENTANAFKVAQSRRLVKPNADIITILGQGRLFPIDTFTPTTIAGYESDTFTIETLNGKKVIKEKMNNGVKTRHLNIRLSLGHTTTMANKKVELAVFLFRGGQTGLDDNSAIATGSSMLFYDTDTRGQSTNLLSVVVNGIDDKFVTEGFFIVLKSLNQSGTNPDNEKLIFSKGDILINIVNSN
jgi:hypothetical protein